MPRRQTKDPKSLKSSRSSRKDESEEGTDQSSRGEVVEVRQNVTTLSAANPDIRAMLAEILKSVLAGSAQIQESTGVSVEQGSTGEAESSTESASSVESNPRPTRRARKLSAPSRPVTQQRRSSRIAKKSQFVQSAPGRNVSSRPEKTHRMQLRARTLADTARSKKLEEERLLRESQVAASSSVPRKRGRPRKMVSQSEESTKEAQKRKTQAKKVEPTSKKQVKKVAQPSKKQVEEVEPASKKQSKTKVKKQRVEDAPVRRSARLQKKNQPTVEPVTSDNEVVEIPRSSRAVSEKASSRQSKRSARASSEEGSSQQPRRSSRLASKKESSKPKPEDLRHAASDEIGSRKSSTEEAKRPRRRKQPVVSPVQEMAETTTTVMSASGSQTVNVNLEVGPSDAPHKATKTLQLDIEVNDEAYVVEVPVNVCMPTENAYCRVVSAQFLGDLQSRN